MNHSSLFELLSETTWRSIESATRNRIQYGEDAITSVNLSALASMPGSNVVVEDTRINEASKGCDFEFWIGSDSTGWARYAIQAKKINTKTSSYAKLGHRVGGSLQIDVLERYAKVNRAAPLYCFYNYSTQKHAWHCNLPVDTTQLGCSVTPSGMVRAAMLKRGGRTFKAIHSNPSTLPWRCLVRCPRLAHSAALGHIGWPPAELYIHKTLPRSIKRLLEERSGSILIDAPEAFNNQFGLRPRWVGVLSLPHEHQG